MRFSSKEMSYSCHFVICSDFASEHKPRDSVINERRHVASNSVTPESPFRSISASDRRFSQDPNFHFKDCLTHHFPCLTLHLELFHFSPSFSNLTGMINPHDKIDSDAVQVAQLQERS
jgi:hypothetical protein